MLYLSAPFPIMVAARRRRYIRCRHAAIVTAGEDSHEYQEEKSRQLACSRAYSLG